MSDWLAAFFIGLAGSVHCVAMCGGVTAGLSLAVPKHANPINYVLSYNTGRILSYAVAGAITGYLSQIVSHQLQHSINWLNLLSGVFLIVLAAFIGGWWNGLTHLERLGQKVWRYLSPLSKKFLPFRSPLSALPYGIIWGWLPCGLVYSSLTWSLASESSVQGAIIMLCFGLGTLPSMLLSALSAQNLLAVLRRPNTKQVMAIILCLFGFFNISKILPNIL